MTSLTVRNNQRFLQREIPFAGAEQWRQFAAEALAGGNRLVGLSPVDRAVPHRLLSIFVDRESSSIRVIGVEVHPDRLELPGLANEFPQLRYFESTLAEEYGYTFSGSTDLRPVRQPTPPQLLDLPRFSTQQDLEMHEVAVGPIHAGVIEPGHFRFHCHGETVYNLDIALGYQHRGVEKLMLGIQDVPPGVRSHRIALAESIAGDTVLGHTGAHCRAMESLAGMQVGLPAQASRCVGEELERIAMHLSGLSGIANDVGYALVASSYGRLRTLAINALAEWSGSRFGRGFYVHGGVRQVLTDDIRASIRRNLETIRHDIQVINGELFMSTGILLRFNELGVVSKDQAQRLGLTGPAARSAGIEIDTRVHFPYGAYRYFPISLLTLRTGDVAARTRIRALEIEDSLRMILDLLEHFPEGPIRGDMDAPEPSSAVISLVEGWRGEIVHTAFTSETGALQQYSILDPSCLNWAAMPLVMRGTAISDFPLCNKSFDLSYAGHDL
ncbi:MAG: hydrogenase [Bacteroidota bacterium]